jgi:ribonuclease P protein component
VKKYGLSAAEKLKSKKDFEELFLKGNTLISSNKRIKVVYLIDKDSEEHGIKAAVAVGKKSGKAFWRNRVKRLLRESIRLNKDILIKITEDNRCTIRIIFSPCLLNMRNNRKIFLRDIMPDVIQIISRISSKI